MPMLWVPVVQAVTTAMLGPLKPYRMDRLPEIMLMTLPGTKNGDILRGPLQECCAVFDAGNAADTRADGHAETVGILRMLGQAGIPMA